MCVGDAGVWVEVVWVGVWVEDVRVLLLLLVLVRVDGVCVLENVCDLVWVCVCVYVCPFTPVLVFSSVKRFVLMVAASTTWLKAYSATLA